MLLLIVIAIFAVRTVIPETNTGIEDITGLLHGEELSMADTNGLISPAREVHSVHEPHSFFYKTDTQRKAGVSNVKARRKVIELNSSDTTLLKTLPGIGPVLSARIIKYRNLLGGFFSVDQLREVYGLSGETFDLIKDRVSVDQALVRQIKINSAGYRELIRLPYLKNFEVTAILKYRELKGRIERLSDLTDNKIITPEKAAIAGQYLSFE